MEHGKSPNANKQKKTMETSPLFARLGKRGRPLENDDVMLDNFFTQKRYLSEVMASTLNSLTMAESLPRTSNNNYTYTSNISSPANCSRFQLQFALSPTRTDGAQSGSARSASPFHSYGDDVMSTMDSAMSEDSEDDMPWRVNGADSLPGPQSSQQSDGPRPQVPNSGLTSEENQARKFKVPAARLPVTQAALPVPAARGPSIRHLADAMEKLPASPSDSLNMVNLRKTALMRSLHLRSQVVEGSHGSPLRTSTRAEALSMTRDAAQPTSALDLTKYAPLTHKDRSGCGVENIWSSQGLAAKPVSKEGDALGKLNGVSINNEDFTASGSENEMDLSDAPH